MKQTLLSLILIASTNVMACGEDIPVLEKQLGRLESLGMKAEQTLLPWALQEAKRRESECLASKAEMKARDNRPKVALGMTQDKVLQSNWGSPIRSHVTTTAGGVKEQWVYPGSNYLYFTNGKLTAIQN